MPPTTTMRSLIWGVVLIIALLLTRIRMAWAATWLDVFPMLASFCFAIWSMISAYLFWPNIWDDSWSGALGELGMYFADIFAAISLMLFFVTGTHLCMSLWVVKSLQSVRQDGVDVSRGPEDGLGLERDPQCSGHLD